MLSNAVIVSLNVIRGASVPARDLTEERPTILKSAEDTFRVASDQISTVLFFNDAKMLRE
jgi:hypothetical protein